jgi:hypothetical protein
MDYVNLEITKLKKAITYIKACMAPHKRTHRLQDLF